MKKFLLIGFGVVGQTIYNSVNDKTVFDIYDPKFIKKNLSIKELELNSTTLNQYHSIFINVPTSVGKDIHSVYDNSILITYLEVLNKINYSGFIFIKSTILPDDILKFTENLKIIYWAEFLSELNSDEDFIKDITPLFGGEKIYKTEVENLIKKYFSHIESIHYTTLEEALYFKYIRNAYISWKITFWNIMAQSKIMDYRQIQKLLSLFPIENEMTHIALDGNFGFGGKCLPKDLDAFNTKLQNPIITELLKYNLEIRK